INVITPGGNYGWSYREGAHPGPRPAPNGFTSIDPIHEYGHIGGAAVVGGLVYHGTNLPGSDGAYLFTDYVYGSLWALRYDGTNATPEQFITAEPTIADFGLDPRNGDILVANQSLQTIRRLVFHPNWQAQIPPTLIDTGIFTNLT